MWLRAILAGLMLFGAAGLASAQYRNQNPGGDPEEYFHNPARVGLQNFRGLLDPSRMHMSNSLSMGYVGGSGVSMSRGLYMNNLDYQISQPLSITTHLGYQFQLNGPAEFNPANNGTQFVGGADLNWRPTNNSNFRLSVYRNMAPDYYYSPFGYNPYGYRPLIDRP